MHPDCPININNMETKLPCENCICDNEQVDKCLNIAWKEATNPENIELY